MAEVWTVDPNVKWFLEQMIAKKKGDLDWQKIYNAICDRTPDGKVFQEAILKALKQNGH